MARFDTTPAAAEAAITTAILSAPGWAQAGITAPNERLRRDAAHELACAILSGAPEEPDSAQMPLAF